MSSMLFSPLELGPLRLANRAAVSPMCQYSANDGCASPWHLQHLMQFAISGAALIVVEATAVERRGRITHGCLGLYSDSCESALGSVLTEARRVAPPGTRFGIQLAHAGRKGSAQRPWEGGNALGPGEDPWSTVAPSAVALAPGWHVPEPLDEAGLERILNAFVDAAGRAARLGFEVIELHMAHGYLLHEFVSPLSNRRSDLYGGSLANRLRFPLAVARAVKSVLPASVVLGARITGSDWSDQGLGPADAVAAARELRALGAAYVCVSSGGIDPAVRVPVGPAYQAPFAARVRTETGIPTQAVGMIVTPDQAESILAEGKADMVALARAFLDNPRWLWHAAERFGADITYPPQYARSKPAVWSGAQLARALS